MNFAPDQDRKVISKPEIAKKRETHIIIKTIRGTCTTVRFPRGFFIERPENIASSVKRDF